jgi:hypothetical protein
MEATGILPIEVFARVKTCVVHDGTNTTLK